MDDFTRKFSIALEKDAEIQQKRAENDTIRKQIDVAQVKLAESEVRVQQRRKSPRETSP